MISDENKRKANQTHYAVLSQNEKANFKALLQNAQLNSMDSIYSGNVADGASYNNRQIPIAKHLMESRTQ